MGAEAYDDCIHVPCPRCQAEHDAYCRNPVNDKPARVPCLDRLKTSITLDRESWDHRDPWEPGQCVWQENCPHQVIAYIEYQVAALPGDPHNTGFDAADLVCSKHLSDMITHALEEPLVADTVVEVGVDPAFLRLTGVDPAFVESEFNDGAMGVSA